MSLISAADAKFSIGSTTSSSNAVSKVDMSLDDIMKSRREQQGSSKTTTTNRRSSSRRKAIDSKRLAATIKDAALNSNKRRQGSRLASKEANLNARRGIRGSKSATKPEVERAIQKEMKKNKKNTSINKKGVGTGVGPRAKPPTRKAIAAAVTAMTGAGFRVPDGMKVVISVEKDESGSRSSTKQTKGGRGSNNRNRK